MRFGVAIIGAGLIGRKRAAALRGDPHSRLVVTVDTDGGKARLLAGEIGGDAESDWRHAIVREDVDIVVVATYNKFLAPISIAALEAGKHVLCEKPLGRSALESKAIIEAAARTGRILKPGFNHRHHKALAHARLLFGQGAIGKLCFMRCVYGHGGRPGYNLEWRGNRDLCGGGELLDQGVHIADFFRWFAGDFSEAFGYTRDYFWGMEMEDNAFALFKHDAGIVASMHTSCTQWKNLFCFEVFGTEGYLIITGLGGSYGPEILRVGRRKPESGPPDEKVLDFSGADTSWEDEWKEFIAAVREGRQPVPSAWDGHMANAMIDAVYRSARSGMPAAIAPD